MNRGFAALLLLAMLAPPGAAQVEFARPFGDHMVLQRGSAVPVFGTAPPGELVTVTFGALTRQVTTDSAGRWSADLGRLAASRQPRELRAAGASGQDVAVDVLVGEVWLASGQSNMEYPIELLDDYGEPFPDLDRPQLRLCAMEGAVRVGKHANAAQLARLTPNEFFDVQWSVSDALNAQKFSAVAWYFAARLNSETGLPIGIIDNAYSGSEIEAWLPRGLLFAIPETSAIAALDVDAWVLDDTSHPWVRQSAASDMVRWRADALLHGVPAPTRHPYEPGFLWEAGIGVLAGMSLAGVIWYQGESNVHDPALYERLQRELVGVCRKHLGPSRLPFLWTQLAAFGPGDEWPPLREAQRACLDLAATGMAVTIDVGHELSIHPPRKAPVGERLARLALRDVYGYAAVEAEGPIPFRARLEAGVAGSQIVRVEFGHAQGLRVRAGETFSGFELVDAQGNAITAVGGISGTDVVLIVSPGFVPASVRYAWAPFPAAPLENGAGLPAVPFAVPVE